MSETKSKTKKTKAKPKIKVKAKKRAKTKTRAKTKAKPKTIRKCGICRKPDHDRRKCPNTVETKKPTKKAETKPAKKHKIVSFKGSSELGKVLLLPSKIDDQVLIRYRNSTSQFSPSHRISIVCRLKEQKRTLFLNKPSRPKFEVTTPKLVLAYDVDSSKLSGAGNTGYLFLSDDEQPTLAASLKTVKAYFFPHVYRSSAYMCLTNRRHGSPRTLNNVFWGSSFYVGWHQHMEYGKHPNCCKVRGTAKQDYQLIQESVCKADTKTMRGFLGCYTDFFETDKKPMGVFLSANKSLLEKVDDANHLDLSSKDGYSGKVISKKFVAGFAFSDGEHWWIYLKDKSFLKLTTEQIKVTL